MTRPKVLDDGQAAEVVAGHLNNETIDELAARFGLSSTPVHRAIIKAGVPFRRRSWRLIEVDVEEIVRRH